MVKQQTKPLQLLGWGALGAVSTMIGDFLLLGVSSAGAEGALGQYLMAAEKISYTRIGLAGFFGYLGIPLTAIGFYALYQMLREKNGAAARLYKMSVYGFAAFGGAIHIVCCYLLTGIKKVLETGTAPDAILPVILAEQGGYVIPCMIVFFAVYLLNIVTMILLIGKGKTPLPKWMWVLNPLTFKILLNAVSRLGTSAFLNGLGCSNMSLGGLLIFAAWAAVLCRKKQ